MRIGLDATPLLGRLTGVGTYAMALLEQLPSVAPDDELVATALTFRGRDRLAGLLPAGVASRARPVPARLLRTLWGAPGRLPVEALTGPLDVFHATNFVLPPTRRAAGVLTVHDLTYLRHPATVAAASRAYRELVPLGIRRAAVVCTPSRAVADQLADAYAVPPDRLAVTPLGVDPAWASTPVPDAIWLQRHGLPTDYVLAVGTLEPRKNLATLVGAYRLLHQRGVELPALVLVGDEGWGDRLDLAALPDGLVVLTGHLPSDDLRRVVAGARLLVFPSLDEGFGLPPLEALACGVPVLASDLPVTREVLGDAVAFCDARGPEGLAEAVHRALAGPVGTPATRRAHAARFTWRATALATHAVYERAISSRR